MRMVPKRACLIWNSELIKERVAWNYWTLANKSRAISPLCSFLKNTMPMLYSPVKRLIHDPVKKGTNNASSGQHRVVVGQLIYDIDTKRVSLSIHSER